MTSSDSLDFSAIQCWPLELNLSTVRVLSSVRLPIEPGSSCRRSYSLRSLRILQRKRCGPESPLSEQFNPHHHRHRSISRWRTVRRDDQNRPAVRNNSCSDRFAEIARPQCRKKSCGVGATIGATAGHRLGECPREIDRYRNCLCSRWGAKIR